MSETPVEPTEPETPPEEVIPPEVPPVEEEPPPRQVQPSSSSYFKISRALEGSDFWVERLKMALEVNEIEITRSVLVNITKRVVEFIDCTEDGAVYTDRVTDEMIDIALEALTV